MNPLISICIPAYKNTSYLKILLNSIVNQTYKNFEVIVTDDSPNDDVKLLCNDYEEKISIQYIKNTPVKGSPANWNEAIKNASGLWIKLMHDDDWFSSEDSLQQYVDIINSNQEIDFIFSAYNDYENNIYKRTWKIKKFNLNRIVQNPLYLFRSNYIGNPSVILVKKNLNFLYDENLKWVVDFEFYMRCIKQMKLFYSPKVLINVGYNSDQITKEVFRNISVEIPENIYMLNKMGEAILKNLIVFDYYWRLFRNLDIRKMEVVISNLNGNELPKSIVTMLQFQLIIPLGLLKIGFLSKSLMLLAYTRHRLLYF